MNIEQEYKAELAQQIASLKSKFTVKQLAMADYLYVYVLDCDDEKPKGTRRAKPCLKRKDGSTKSILKLSRTTTCAKVSVFLKAKPTCSRCSNSAKTSRFDSAFGLTIKNRDVSSRFFFSFLSFCLFRPVKSKDRDRMRKSPNHAGYVLHVVRGAL